MWIFLVLPASLFSSLFWVQFSLGCSMESSLASVGAANHPCGLEPPTILLYKRSPRIRLALTFPCSCCFAKSLPCLKKQEILLLSWKIGCCRTVVTVCSVLELAWGMCCWCATRIQDGGCHVDVGCQRAASGFTGCIH